MWTVAARFRRTHSPSRLRVGGYPALSLHSSDEPGELSYADTQYTVPCIGGRLSRPRHCSKGVQPVPKAAYCSRFRNKHNCLREFTMTLVMMAAP